jgi:hypothetical protein
MTGTEKPKAAKKPLQGRRKGGTIFPKLNLKQALGYSTKLVSKTHTGPLPQTTILPGVFGNSGSNGKIRASALKQFGLLEGSVEAYKATQLAKDIDATPEGDRPPLIQKALLTSKLFKEIFETFSGDTVARAKIEQRAKGLDVHPDSAANCAQLFIESVITARLGTLNGDSISLSKLGDVVAAEPESDTGTSDDTAEQAEKDPADEQPIDEEPPSSEVDQLKPERPGKQSAKPGVNLNLTVDPSSDPDKLEKQLKLLRHFGII